MRLRLYVCGLLLALPLVCLAEAPVMPGVKLATPPKIDGTVEESEWAQASSLSGMYDENDGSPVTDQARYWLAYDENFIYFAAKFSDAHPGPVRAVEYRKNAPSLDGDDAVYLVLDTSGSLADYNEFGINPRSATSIELAGGRAAKREWTGEFEAKSRITETGWETEARIPWQVLRLPASGKRNLRVNFIREVARSQRTFVAVYTGDGKRNDVPIWESVELPAQVQRRTLKLLPYIYGGLDEEEGVIANAGLDLKTSLTDSIELVGTINPDFRNIENAILSLDFSRFERLAAESRPFFQEGRSYYSTGLFASQRIRNFDVGLNTYGRLGNSTSFGVIATADWDKRVPGGDTRGTEWNGLLNVTHDPSPTLSMRFSATGLDRPGLSNQATLARITKRFGLWSIEARNLTSNDTQRGIGHMRDASLNYGVKNWYGWLHYSEVSPDFLPRLGFFPERDYKGWQGGGGYSRNLNKGPINDWGFDMFAVSLDRINGDFYRTEKNFSLFTTLRPSGLAIVTNYFTGDFEGVVDELFSINIGGPRGNPYRNAGISLDKGRLADQDYQSFTIYGSYRIRDRLQLSLNHQELEHFDHLSQTIFSANYDLGNDRSVSGRLVRFNEDTNFYLSFRQSGNRGAEYYLIVGDPNAPTFRSSVILKAIIPFEIVLSGGRKKESAPQVISASK